MHYMYIGGGHHRAPNPSLHMYAPDMVHLYMYMYGM